MALLDVVQHIKDYLIDRKRCDACTARDYTIAALKEIIHQKDEFILQLEIKNEATN